MTTVVFNLEKDTTAEAEGGLRITIGAAELVLKGEDRMEARKVLIGSEVVYLTMVADGHGGCPALGRVPRGAEQHAHQRLARLTRICSGPVVGW